MCAYGVGWGEKHVNGSQRLVFEQRVQVAVGFLTPSGVHRNSQKLHHTEKPPLVRRVGPMEHVMDRCIAYSVMSCYI